MTCWDTVCSPASDTLPPSLFTCPPDLMPHGPPVLNIHTGTPGRQSSYPAASPDRAQIANGSPVAATLSRDRIFRRGSRCSDLNDEADWRRRASPSIDKYCYNVSTPRFAKPFLPKVPGRPAPIPAHSAFSERSPKPPETASLAGSSRPATPSVRHAGPGKISGYGRGALAMAFVFEMSGGSIGWIDRDT